MFPGCDLRRCTNSLGHRGRCELPRLRIPGFCLTGGSAVIPTLWNVWKPLCENCVFKTPGNLKKKNCGCCFGVPCCNTGKDHKRVDILKTHWSSERSLLTTFVVFCGFARRNIHAPRYHGQYRNMAWICIPLGWKTCKTVTAKAITALLVKYVTNVNFSLLIAELWCLNTME